jgi:hypothetical protein
MWNRKKNIYGSATLPATPSHIKSISTVHNCGSSLRIRIQEFDDKTIFWKLEGLLLFWRATF